VVGADSEALGATVAWALHPSGGTAAAALVEVADDRLQLAPRGAHRGSARAGALAPRTRPA
jgi:hypothetical protein